MQKDSGNHGDLFHGSLVSLVIETRLNKYKNAEAEFSSFLNIPVRPPGYQGTHKINNRKLHFSTATHSPTETEQENIKPHLR